MATKYNPYNSVKKISELKGKYHNAKDVGEDYKQYQREAETYYQDLMANGYTDLANELTATGFNGSLDILARYKPDSEFKVDNDLAYLRGESEPKTETAGYYEEFMKYMDGGPLPGTSSSKSDDILDRLYTPGWEDTYNQIMGNAADLASGKTTPGTSDAVQGILDSFRNTDDLLNGRLTVDRNGKVTGGLNIDHYNTGKDQLDFINNFDYTSQPYFDAIMGTYRLKGDDAAQGALASGASGNSGNIDSYAAANANRQQLAFTNAGHQAALAAAQQNQNNWQKLYDSMGGHLTDMGTINAGNLVTGANMYATDALERQNALNQSVTMADAEAQRRIDAYLAKLADDSQRYGIDAEVLMNRENNATNMANAEAQRRIDQYLAELTDSTNRYGIDAEVGMNSVNNQAEMDRLMAEIAGEKELAGINNTAELQRLGRELAAEKYIAYLNSQTPVEQNQEADDVDESSAEGEAEYDADTIARNVIAGIEGGILTNIKSYDDFARYLINNGVSISDATKLRDEWESILPYLFTDTSAMDRNANKVTGGKALAGPPVHTLK